VCKDFQENQKGLRSRRSRSPSKGAGDSNYRKAVILVHHMNQSDNRGTQTYRDIIKEIPQYYFKGIVMIEA